MLDKNNYPDPECLRQIEQWDLTKQPVEGLLDLVAWNTCWADRQIERRGKHVIYFTYHTGGWSGNEDVIEYLRRNTLFWSMCWEKSTRGGHHYFRIDKRAFPGVRE